MEGEQSCCHSHQRNAILNYIFHVFLRSLVRHRMLMKVVMARKVCCHRPMLRLPVSTALKLRFGKSVAAQLLPLVINTTLLIAGAVQGCDSVLPALHTLTGSWVLFLSMCLCLCTHTHTEQCTPNNHKEEEHNLYPRETGACSVVLCHILQI